MSFFKCKKQKVKQLEIEKKECRKWNNANCVSWAKNLWLEKSDEEKLVKLIKKKKITGKNLLTEDNETLFFELNERIRTKLKYNIQTIVEKKSFDKKWSTVYHKVFSLSEGDEAKDVFFAANILGYKDRFYEKYFSFFVKYFNLKEMEFNHQDLVSDGKNSKAKKLKKKIERAKEELNEQYRVLNGGTIDQLRYSECGFKKKDKKETQWRLPMKIIVTEIFDERDNMKRSLRELFSQFVGLIPKFKSSTKFGLFHTAITIGPWYLEWNTGEICIPKKIFSSSKAIMCADIPELMTVGFDNIQNLVNIIVDVVFKWNSSMFYGQSLDEKHQKGNCQNFIDELLESLKLQTHSIYKGMFGQFIKELRLSGNCAFDFKPSEEFLGELGVKWKKIHFKTHTELDKLVDVALLKIPELKTKYQEEYYFLKSIDRAFWLRFIKNNENSAYKPMVIVDEMFEEEFKCPFKDPRKTMSYI